MVQTIRDLSLPGALVTPALTHHVILGNPAKAAQERGGVATLQAVKGLIGGFTPVSLGSATVSAQVSTWRATNLVIPSAGAWFLLLVDLPAHRGNYLMNGDQWRRLPVASAGGTPAPAESIPLAGGVSYGRAGGGTLLISYDQAQSGMGSYDVEVFRP